MYERYKMRVVVKVGSSTLVYENGKMNIHRVNELCEVLADLKNAGHEVILVSSGAIALGVGKLALAQKPKDIPTKQAAASVGQCELMYNYDRIFSKYNHIVSQILLTGADFESIDRHQNFNNTILRLLQLGVLPIINENDTIATEEIKVDGKGTGVSLTQYSLSAGTTYADSVAGLLNVIEVDPKNPDVSFKVLNCGDYTWSKDTMGNAAVKFNEQTEGTVIAAMNGDPWIVYHTDYDGDGNASTGSGVKHVSVSRGLMIKNGEIWATVQILSSGMRPH